MSYQRIQAQLTQREFPFNFSELSGTVVYADQKLLARAAGGSFAGKQAEQQMGVPQAYYMENCVPISRGYSSVMFKTVLPATDFLLGTITYQEALKGERGELAFMVTTTIGQFVLDIPTETWYDVTRGVGAEATVYAANVLGTSYVFIRGYGIYRYNFDTHQLDRATAKGIDIGVIAGMVAAGTLLVLWDNNNTFFWSSFTDPLDFVPSLSTGAGSTNVVAITSKIVTCAPYGEDFIIYTRENMVAARQTGDINFPLRFQEIIGSNGIWDRTHIGVPPTATPHIAWTNTGFQEINLEQATMAWPELRDGITRGVRILFDTIKGTPYVDRGPIPTVRVSFCSSNFVCVSLRYDGEDSFSEAFVYDISLGRWGKLNVPHQYIVENPIVRIFGGYTYQDMRNEYLTYADLRANNNRYFDICSNIDTTAGDPGIRFGILQADGALFQGQPHEAESLVYTPDSPASVPRLFLGKYKLTQNNSCRVDTVYLRGLANGLIRLHSHMVNGDFIGVTDNASPIRHQEGAWALYAEADAVSIEVEGAFTLTEVSLHMYNSGIAYAHGNERAKKYVSYISSGMFPLYVAEEKEASGEIGSFLDVLAMSLVSVELDPYIIRASAEAYLGYTAVDVSAVEIDLEVIRASTEDPLALSEISLQNLEVRSVITRLLSDEGLATPSHAIQGTEIKRIVLRLPTESAIRSSANTPSTSLISVILE